MTLHTLACFAQATILLLATLHGSAEELVPVDRDRVMGEENYRVLIHEREKDLKTLFYYFDGKQTFAAFEKKDRTKNNILLLIIPDWADVSIDYKIDEKKRPFNPTHFKIRIAEVDDETGKFVEDSTDDAVLGGWITVKPEQKVELDIILVRHGGRWRLMAKKAPNGKWKGSMNQIKPDKTEQGVGGKRGGG